VAFNNLQPASGPFGLSVGGTAQVWVKYNGGSDDLGAQWIEANPIGPGTLQVDKFIKSRTVNSDGRSFAVTYLCTVTAIDDGGSGLGVLLFNLDGGGNV
jgi:hypothetical protein